VYIKQLEQSHLLSLVEYHPISRPHSQRVGTLVDGVMRLCIVISKAGGGEARITSDSDLNDILRFLRLLGVNGWDLSNKGTPKLETNGPHVYVAIGPPSPEYSKISINRGRSLLIPDDGGLKPHPQRVVTCDSHRFIKAYFVLRHSIRRSVHR
jgi:hypothetical protein